MGDSPRVLGSVSGSIGGQRPILHPDITPRRLVLLFDGTWNRREHATNVWRLRLFLEHSEHQLVYYDEGVGTNRFEKIRGGAFGTGLSRKVLSGYLWLLENYREESSTRPADEIYIFGFSRGAFTARSLTGFLSICGLVRRDAEINILNAFKLYRSNGASRTDPDMHSFRQRYSLEVRIKLLGVWDTVAALGVPKLDLPFLERYSAHKVDRFHEIVDHGLHALALDEHRKLFQPSLWLGPTRTDQTLEQRWFTGAHSNVGGGYDRDDLFLRPLQWMIQEAEKKGLTFRSTVPELTYDFYSSVPRDSLLEHRFGFYKILQLGKPFYREVILTDASAQTVDYTVLQRWLWVPGYNPPPLQGILGPRLDRRRGRLPPSSDEICQLLPNMMLSAKHPDAFVVKPNSAGGSLWSPP